jgi:hypothetical protein
MARLPLALLALPLLLGTLIPGCVRYEYEHEFWLETDGSGTVYITGRPVLWAALKDVGQVEEADQTISRDEIRRLLERSGLRVRRVTRVTRGGQTYLFAAADFRDVNALAHTPAFPDLDLQLVREGGQLRLTGAWRLPADARPIAEADRAGLMAVRFHLPAKVYEHKNAFAGVERGNIVAWRQTVAEGLAGRPLEFGARMDRRSILRATIVLFLESIAAGGALIVVLLYLVYRRGKRLLAAEQPTPRRAPPTGL